MKRIRLGISGLDEMLEGGIPEGSIIAVMGSFGTGKTTLAMQFINYGLENGEKCVYISLEEDEESILQTAENYGWNFKRHLENDRLRIIVLDPEDLRKLTREIENELPSFLKEFSAKRVAVDSVSLLTMLMESEMEKRKAVLMLSRIFKQCGVTAILTSEVDKDNPYVSRDGLVEYVADGVILLSYYRHNNEVKLILEIVKMRRTSHLRRIKPYEIGKNGIRVLSKAELY